MADHPLAACVRIARGLCGGLLALAALVACLSRLRRDRYIADTPLVRIRSAAQGYVRVQASPRIPWATTLRSPLTGRACVWWDYRVDYRKENARRARRCIGPSNRPRA